MISTITFKTELSDILTLEEVVVPFDSIKSKTRTEMISLSIFPIFNEIRNNILKQAERQRNAELSQLLIKIAERKQEIKINMWKVLSAIGTNKKKIQNDSSRAEDLEQIIYEEEQIIKTYENSIKSLENKEKKIMNGKYAHVDRARFSSKKKILKKQLIELKEMISQISTKHDDCFIEFLSQLDDLIDDSTIKSFPRNLNKMAIESSINTQSIVVSEEKELSDEKMHYIRRNKQKDYYLYEPNEKKLEDELIFQLLSQGRYDSEGGTINGLITSADAE